MTLTSTSVLRRITDSKLLKHYHKRFEMEFRNNRPKIDSLKYSRSGKELHRPTDYDWYEADGYDVVVMRYKELK